VCEIAAAVGGFHITFCEAENITNARAFLSHFAPAKKYHENSLAAMRPLLLRALAFASVFFNEIHPFGWVKYCFAV